MKRIFTKWLGGEYLASAAAPQWSGETLQFTAQEPLTILGAHMEVAVITASENDGMANLGTELSFSSTREMDIAFLSVVASEWWNTAPPGISIDNGSAEVIFPEGYGLSMKEGETVFLNIKVMTPKSAGTTFFTVNAHIYYVKGAAI